MKVFIQHEKNGYYLDASGTWTPERDRAVAFEYGSHAVEHCIHNKLSGVHLLYSDSNPEMDFVLNPFKSKVAREARQFGPGLRPESPASAH